MTVDVFGGQARACAQYLAKGSRIVAEGELDWREWTTQDGQHREAITLKARSVLFEGTRTDNDPLRNTAVDPATSQPMPAASTAAPPTPTPDNGTPSPDDIPF